MSREIQEYTVEKGEENSCRFCPIGLGTNKVFDAETNETFYLCDAHLAEYNIDTDKIPDPPEPEPAPEPKP